VLKECLVVVFVSAHVVRFEVPDFADALSDRVVRLATLGIATVFG
jgi:uncharacterized membrane protein